MISTKNKKGETLVMVNIDTVYTAVRGEGSAPVIDRSLSLPGKGRERESKIYILLGGG